MSHIRLLAAILFSLIAPLAFADGQNIDKVNGSITADAGQSYGTLQTVNGAIQIGDGAHTGNAGTVNGAIHVGVGAQTGGLETVNGGIRLGQRVQVGKGVETVNGGVFVDRGGRIGGDVSTVNGAIGLVDSDIAGGIETVNGDVTVGVGSHVKGGIRIEKPHNSWLPMISIGKRRVPRIIIGPDAVVEGPLLFEREVKLYVHASARIGKVSGATPVPFTGTRAPQD